VEREVSRTLLVAKTDDCLFCRDGGGPFTSVEHIFAESLDNKDLILPKGIVCDPCNNGKLSELDRAIVDFMPIATRRTVLGVTNEEGRLRQLSL
jgi:transposase